MLLSLALAATAYVAPHGAVTIAMWRDQKDAGAREVNNLYIAGVMAGYVGLNSVLEEQGRPVICYPEKLPFNGNLAVSILTTFTDDHPETRPFPVEVVLLRALQDTFPCKAGK